MGGGGGVTEVSFFPVAALMDNGSLFEPHGIKVGRIASKWHSQTLFWTKIRKYDNLNRTFVIIQLCKFHYISYACY